ncbi:MAG: hypothetical protein WBN66_01695, partial [Smithella sp.]
TAGNPIFSLKANASSSERAIKKPVVLMPMPSRISLASLFLSHQNNAAIEHGNGVTQILKRKYRRDSNLFVGAMPDDLPIFV